MKFYAKHKITLEFLDEIEAKNLSEACRVYDNTPLPLTTECFLGASVRHHELIGIEAAGENDDSNFIS